jgi:hypothetical protein
MALQTIRAVNPGCQRLLPNGIGRRLRSVVYEVGCQNDDQGRNHTVQGSLLFIPFYEDLFSKPVLVKEKRTQS